MNAKPQGQGISQFAKNALKNFFLALNDASSMFLDSREIAILCYHSISDAQVSTAVSAKAFACQLEHLQAHGYVFVSLDAVLEWIGGKRALPRKAIALTFDDGYADFETAALPILEKCKAPAGLFVLGDPEHSRKALANDIPLLAPDALARVLQHPLITLGYHSRTHANLAKSSGETLAAEMTAPFSTRYFAYPGGNYASEAVTLARSLGYRAAFSIKRHLVRKDSDRYALPRSVITGDMSLATVRFHATRALEWYRSLAGAF